MGVEKQLITPGKGPRATCGQTVIIHCTGFGKNNDLTEMFWSSRDSDDYGPKAFTFQIGEGHVIKGLDEGVTGMQIGEVARLKCSPDYAYGANGFPIWGVQPNSQLEFEMEVLCIEVESGTDDAYLQIANHIADDAYHQKEEELYSSLLAYGLKDYGALDVLEESGSDDDDYYYIANDAEEQKAEELFSSLVAYGLSEYSALHVLSAQEENLRYSKMALHYYHEIQNDEFELVKPLHSQTLELYPPGAAGGCLEYWCHLCFIARPKNIADSDATPKYFFAELMKKPNERKFNVMSCMTFERSDCHEFDHGCLICPPVMKLHPREGKYVAGSPPYRHVEWCWDAGEY